ncbi:hypothetical protein EMCG_09271 [[Emmonsia] crescens]|uniref:Uncharacterized protein n=1 Tax=[Emmonsia] crescens TaxID=73230 RepID=A0A0G2J3A4_9EURO|nr:hypothetical protein EMCG_09271 [Emmonsia crescens UAMH 3008]
MDDTRTLTCVKLRDDIANGRGTVDAVSNVSNADQKDGGLHEGSRVRNLACQALVKKQHILGNQPCSDFLAMAFSDGHANNMIADFELGSIRGSYYLDPAGNIPGW